MDGGFIFALGQTVQIVGSSSVEGQIVGRLHDANGRHYEVELMVACEMRRKWFREARLHANAQGPS